MAVNCFRSLWWALIREATLGPSRVSGLLRAACRVTGMDRQLGRGGREGGWGEGREGSTVNQRVTNITIYTIRREGEREVVCTARQWLRALC